MVKEHHQGPQAHNGLVVESKYGQKEDGIGLKMEGVDPIVRKDGEEELRERRDQPGLDVVEKEGVGGRPQAGPRPRAWPDLGHLPFILIAGHQQEHRSATPTTSRLATRVVAFAFLPAGGIHTLRSAGKGSERYRTREWTVRSRA